MTTQKSFYDMENPKEALRKRNVFAKEMKAQGFNIVKSSLGNQLLSFGGIGTNQPHIERWVKVYMVTYFK